MSPTPESGERPSVSVRRFAAALQFATLRGFVSMVVLSAFEARWPGMLPFLAQTLDAQGYERLWTTENHTVRQGGSPTVQAAVAAAVTSRLKIGAMGAKVRYLSPLRLAKDYHLLELLYSARIDLAIDDGAAASPDVDAALGAGPCELDYPGRVSETVGYIRESAASEAGRSICRGATNPRLWLASNQAADAELAGRLGLGLIYQRHIAGLRGREQAPNVVARYREAFIANSWMSAPRVVLLTSGSCTATGRDAFDRWRTAAGEMARSIVPTVSDCLGRGFFCGSPSECRDQLESLAEVVAADEVAIQCQSDSWEAAMQSYCMVAESFGLTARVGALDVDGFTSFTDVPSLKSVEQQT